MAGGMQFDFKGATPYSTNGMGMVRFDGTSFPLDGYGADATTQEQVCFEGRLKGYTSGDITAEVDWYADTATSGGIVVGSQLGCITPGDATNIETKALATANVSGTSSASATAHGLRRATITISNVDGAAADDWFVIKIYRDVAAAGDDMTGDAIMRRLTLSWS